MRTLSIPTLLLSLGLALPLVGCGSDDPPASDDGADDGSPDDADDQDGPDTDGPDDQSEDMSDDDADGQEPDAGSDEEPDAGPDSDDPLDSTEPTNTPNATISYGGTEPSGGMTLLGSHLALEETGTALSIDWYGRVRNDFTSTVCAFAIDVSFAGASGELLALDTLADMRPYADDDGGTTDCVGPGEVFYLYASDFQSNGAGTFTLDDVTEITWKYQLGGYLTDTLPADHAEVGGLSVDVASIGLGYALKGEFTNGTASTLEFPGVTAYLLNAGGQPLKRMVDSSSDDVAGFGSWTFEAGFADEPFEVDDVDILVSWSIF
jgi:hypothetical protein